MDEHTAIKDKGQRPEARRVSLFAAYHEIWQGTLGQFCYAWRMSAALARPGSAIHPGNVEAVRLAPADVAAMIDAQMEGMSVRLASLESLRLPGGFGAVGYLKWTHYYADPKTGSAYTAGENISGVAHWDREGPIRATLGQTRERTPLVTISTGFGFDGDYTPAQIRAYAQTLLRIADDAEAQPMGPRSFHRSVRGYDT